uniref:Uncharacterized protein n=1 Tax=Vitis vinifera TaxID=29760 RepID=F6HJ19_VITVI
MNKKIIKDIPWIITLISPHISFIQHVRYKSPSIILIKGLKEFKIWHFHVVRRT